MVEGKIGFIYSSDNGSKKVLMDPGQKLVYDTRDSKVQLYATSGESEIAWKEGKIIFRNTPLEEDCECWRSGIMWNSLLKTTA